MDLSIVIVNWNGLAVLRNCLASIFGASQGVEFEVVVVDNASHDDSVSVIQRGFPQVVILRNQQNLGFAAANNQGFAVARGRYVLLLNNDTLVLAGALAESVRYLDANPSVGVLGCRVEFPNRSFQTSCYRFSNLLELFMTRLLPLGSAANERLNLGRYWGRQFTGPTEVDVVAGCFMVVRREVIASVGGFDEDFFMYGEDEEWCSRIKRAGWRIIYFPGATIIHLHRFSSRQARRALRVIECMSPVLVLHKRRGPLIAWFGNLILLFGLLVRLPAWLVLDAIHICKGTAQEGLFRSRFVALAAHLKGIVWPVWLPDTAKPAVVSAHPAATAPVLR
jgi:GT2 family glycosyltransferase